MCSCSLYDKELVFGLALELVQRRFLKQAVRHGSLLSADNDEIVLVTQILNRLLLKSQYPRKI